LKRTSLFKNIKSTFNSQSALYPELSRVRGIGKSKLINILRKINFQPSKRINSLSTEQKLLLEQELLLEEIEDVRKSRLLEIIDVEKAIGSTRGFRHSNKLKLRGQKTKSTGRKTKKTRVKKK